LSWTNSRSKRVSGPALAVVLVSLLVALAGQDRKTRILLKQRIGEGELALIKNRSPVRLDNPGMHAIATEAGIVGEDSGSHGF
jgi:hypothetical protein